MRLIRNYLGVAKSDHDPEGHDMITKLTAAAAGSALILGAALTLPATAYAARPKAQPTGPRLNPHYRVRRDRSDAVGVVSQDAPHDATVTAIIRELGL